MSKKNSSVNLKNGFSDFEDLSYKEIEEKLNESASTVRVKIFRAKKMLANFFLVLGRLEVVYICMDMVSG